jgi:N6-adenosine-specific RNA methylase IME4
MIELPRILGGFKSVMADPPWPEQGGGVIKRGADRHYDLMSVEEIAALPVRSIVASEAHLYLWVTNNYLMRANEVIKAWGFEYKTNLCWPKPRFGLGQYFRGQHEICLFATRGVLPYRTKPDGKRAQWPTLLKPWLGEHSQKPPEIYEAIECVSYPPYLELFARAKRPGWEVWGLEAPSEITLESNALQTTLSGEPER